MRERIEFDNPKTMDEVMCKVRICYQQSKLKGEVTGKKGTDNRNNRLAGNSKGSHGGSNRSFAKGPNNINFQKKSLRTRPPSESRTNELPGKLDSEVTTRPPIQCWGCGGPHYIKNCPQRKGSEQISQIQEASTVGDVGRSIPRIDAALEDRQAEYQRTMVELEGKILDFFVTILIDPGATLSYISLKVVEHCKLQAIKFKNPWLTIYYRDELGIQQEMQGIKWPVQIQPVIASHLAKCIRKRCQIYAIQVGYSDSKEKTTLLENIAVIQEFADVFPEEIPELPPKRDIDFTIELVPGAAPVS
eukprot:PITA_04903